MAVQKLESLFKMSEQDVLNFEAQCQRFLNGELEVGLLPFFLGTSPVLTPGRRRTGGICVELPERGESEAHFESIAESTSPFLFERAAVQELLRQEAGRHSLQV